MNSAVRSHERQRAESGGKRWNPLAGARGYIVAMLVAVSVSLRAVEIAASGLSFPFFAENGQITHKIVAKRGSMSGPLQNLQHVEIEYYADGDPRRVVQRVIADEATWNEKTEVLEGSGTVRVETPENRLTGDGFRFEVGRSQLNIRRNFAMTNRDLRLTSDRAIVDLILERADNDGIILREVKRCEAVGNLRVEVLPTARRKFEYDEAHSERAIYEGASHTIFFPQETRLLKSGKPPARTNRFSIKLDPKSRPGEKLKR